MINSDDCVTFQCESIGIFNTFDCIEPSLGGTCTVPQTLHATYTCLFPYPMVY